MPCKCKYIMLFKQLNYLCSISCGPCLFSSSTSIVQNWLGTTGGQRHEIAWYLTNAKTWAYGLQLGIALILIFIKLSTQTRNSAPHHHTTIHPFPAASH